MDLGEAGQSLYSGPETDSFVGWCNYVFSKISLTRFQGVLHTFPYQYLLSRINGDSACP